MVRHYFPGVDIDSLSDEEFAVLSNDAGWMHAEMLNSSSAALAAMFGAASGNKRR